MPTSFQPAPQLAVSDPVATPLLGEILHHDDVISEMQLDEALAQQQISNAHLGKILFGQGAASTRQINGALSKQQRLGQIDLAAMPADIDLVRAQDPATCLRLGYIPWRRVGNLVVFAVSDPARRSEILAANPLCSGIIRFVIAEETEIKAIIARVFARRLRDQTRDRCPSHLACRDWHRGGSHFRLVFATLVLAGLAVLHPMAVALFIICWIWFFNLATTALRLASLLVYRGNAYRNDKSLKLRQCDMIAPGSPHDLLCLSKKSRIERPLTSGTLVLSQEFLERHEQRMSRRRKRDTKLPKVSILIPLLREDKVLEKLVAALNETTYPKPLLDIKLVVEADDKITAKALQGITLPVWISVLRVPFDELRTKPRAMNYALEFCAGEIVGVYDAEDRPAPDQIMKIVRRFQDAPPEVACLQGYLDFYNPKQNWLARCFTIEYSIWFRVLLKGVSRLGFPIPLGGTTVFFRRRVLEKVGCWDAHNVTEDADLGIRLARFGYRSEMVDTTTMEEANCLPGAWIKQRSRWLKGYAITWATHMRDPVGLMRDLGVGGFIGFQILFLGALTGYLTAPVMWAFWLVTFGVGLPLEAVMPIAVWWVLFGTMVVSQLVYWAVAIVAVSARTRLHLLMFIPTIGLYFPLGTLAAYKAFLELFRAPFFWDKTRHGL